MSDEPKSPPPPPPPPETSERPETPPGRVVKDGDKTGQEQR